MMRVFLAFVFLSMVASCSVTSPGSGELGYDEDPNRRFESLEDSMNYILGTGVFTVFQYDSSDDFRSQAFSSAVTDFIDGKDFKLTKEQQFSVINRYREQTKAVYDSLLLLETMAFLETNAKRPEVKTIERGLQYEVVKSGPVDGLIPDGNDVAKIRYSQGTQFGIVWDQSMATNPASKDTVQLALNRELTGFSQACQNMRVGDKWKVWLPPAIGSAAGRCPAGTSKKNEVLYMEIELLGIIERNKENTKFLNEFIQYPGYFKDESKRIIVD